VGRLFEQVGREVMKWLCRVIGHRFEPVEKKTRVNPYFIPPKACVRCGERW
jgi:hypothetical protein